MSGRDSRPGHYVSVGALEQKKQQRPLTWRTTWKRRAPLTGLSCILLALLCMAASFIILKESDNVAVDSWKYQPSTYLAIFTALGNQALQFAAVQGVVVLWWSRALEGSTLARLHRDWDVGTSIWSSVAAGRRMDILAASCIVSTLVAIDGPLLQRASRVKYTQVTTQAELEVNIAPEMPHAYTGKYAHTKQFETANISPFLQGLSNLYSPEVRGSFTSVFDEWARGSPIVNEATTCNGTCQAKIRGPALVKTNCTETTARVNYTVPASLYPKMQLLNNTMFIVTLGVIPSAYEEYINFTVAYALTDENNPCTAGTVIARTCQLRSAIGLYAATISGSTIVLDSPVEVEILQKANNTGLRAEDSVTSPGETLSTLSGIVEAAFIRYFNEWWAWYTPGDDGAQDFGSGNFWFAYQHEINMTRNCPAFQDPTAAVMESMNDLMFRGGIDAAKTIKVAKGDLFDEGIVLSQNVTAVQHNSHNSYRTTYLYFFAAALVEVVCGSLILSTYYGWWRIGREVSFSPLEIAKAFDAPLLAGSNSNASASEIVEAVGEIRVRYGATGRIAGEGEVREYTVEKLSFADPGVVYRPLDSFRFQS